MTFPIRSVAVLATCFAMTSVAHAQTPASAAAMAQVPVNVCQDPGNAPLDRASPDMTRFAKRVEEYKLCTNKYVTEQGAKSNELADQARAYGEAANKAIDDYNTYINKLNEQTKSDKSGAKKN
jgi:hypothetical protein